MGAFHRHRTRLNLVVRPLEQASTRRTQCAGNASLLYAASRHTSTLRCGKIVGRKSREKKLRTQRRGSENAPMVVTRRPPGLRKMSEVLVDVSEPLLRGLDAAADPANYHAALLLGAALWNASAPGSPLGGAAAKLKVLAEIRKRSPAADAPEIERRCDEVMERARDLYPDEVRIIVNVQVDAGSDGRCHINVASAGSHTPGTTRPGATHPA